jgi:hypothetical protein
MPGYIVCLVGLAVWLVSTSGHISWLAWVGGMLGFLGAAFIILRRAMS